MFKKIVTNPFFIFPVLTCVVFWPLSLHLFTLKNDALVYYYPIRTLISDALHNHQLPLWTPYINMGYPLHGDMQSGAWNPVIWIFAFLTNYSLGAFHCELLFYFCFAGIGFYYLCREYGWSKTTAFAIAIAYELSGFMIDSTQFFVCISAACYIPYIFIFFRRTLNGQLAKDAIATAFFLYLLFVGSYPSLFIITGYFLLAYGLFVFFMNKEKMAYLKKLTLPFVLVIVLFTLLSLPAIVSFVQHLPYIERGKTQSLDFVLQNSMPPTAMFSLISPFSTTATSSWINTDPLMRNTYIGIIPLVFLLYGLFNKAIRNNKEIRFFLVMSLVMFGLAWGSYFFLRPVAYYILPLMNTFRHPALFRLFGIFCLLMAAGHAFNAYQKNNNPEKQVAVSRIIIGSAVILLVIAISMVFINGAKVIPGFHYGAYSFRQLDFSQRFSLQVSSTLLILFIFYTVLRKKNAPMLIALVCMLDLFITTQYNMPVTIIGAKRFQTVETAINRDAERFPLPDNSSIEYNSLNSFDSSQLIGTKLFYEKKIGRNDYFITPGNLSLQDSFYNSPIRNVVFKNPVLYFADTLLVNAQYPDGLLTSSFNNNDSITITAFSGNGITSTIDSKSPRQLVYLQNYYPGWKAFIDGKQASINKVNITFMEVAVPAGKHELVFSYSPALVIYCWYISLIALMATLVALAIRSFRRRSFLLSQQDQ